MRGIGGPLLCIGDLLNYVGEEADPSLPDYQQQHLEATPSSSSISNLNVTPLTSDLTKLFQENYDQLKEALAGTDQSWTALTLKLCTALATANQLVQSTNSNVELLSEKVGELQKIIKRGDSAISAAKAVHVAQYDERSGN
ncbi:Histone-lysine N-methyltransferase [Quillaja saponaria]|uniref:Histone-lysine N-methyltransferase n=1 Tax=Quillaja saponaria TaxID=32244 RepID=A0AAD7LJ44_QUISA|nr:Histone-lysine N-methyltransferase [Quillaja saponaria]